MGIEVRSGNSLRLKFLTRSEFGTVTCSSALARASTVIAPAESASSDVKGAGLVEVVGAGRREVAALLDAPLWPSGRANLGFIFSKQVKASSLAPVGA